MSDGRTAACPCKGRSWTSLSSKRGAWRGRRLWLGGDLALESREHRGQSVSITDRAEGEWVGCCVHGGDCRD